jgi:hypothetical protein
VTVRLRAHHLLCLLTYVGKGYGPGFTANYDRIVARLNRGETILIVSGPDDICAPLLKAEAEPHCQQDSVAERDERAAESVAALLGRPVRAGTHLELGPAHLETMRQAFSTGQTRAACQGCEWSTLCDAIAADGYPGVRLRRPARE